MAGAHSGLQPTRTKYDGCAVSPLPPVPRVLGRAAALEVDEWDFVSSHALAQEYVRLHTDTAAGASTGAKGGGKKRRASIG